MEASILKVIEAMATDIVRLAKVVMEEKGITSDSILIQNIRTLIAKSKEGIVIDTLFNNYINYVEQGRVPKQGKRPPIDALRDWAVSRGIEPDNDTLWAISTAIWRDGIKPRPILATLEDYIEEGFESKWADKLFDVLIDDFAASIKD